MGGGVVAHPFGLYCVDPIYNRPMEQFHGSAEVPIHSEFAILPTHRQSNQFDIVGVAVDMIADSIGNLFQIYQSGVQMADFLIFC
jgi:hypothetical protein